MFDSTTENKEAKELDCLERDEVILRLDKYLSNSDFQARAYGLRLIKRIKANNYVIEAFIPHLLSVRRLTELEYWYKSFLSKYSLSKLLPHVIDTLNDSMLDKHQRALSILIANNGNKHDKKIYKQYFK